MSDDQQYILRWHHHENTLLSGLPQLLEAEILTDITVSAGCGHVRAHRLVLATCSSYFLELFHDMPPMQHPIVILKDMEYDDLCCLISFMYRGQCKVSADRLQTVLAMAKMLRIRGLCDMTVPPTPASSSSASPNYMYSSQNPVIHTPLPLVPKFESESVVKVNDCDLNGNLFPSSSDAAKETNSSPSFKLPRNSQSVPTECQICGKQLSNQYNLRVHLETHENGQHACTLCPHVSRSRDALRKHVSYRHPESSTDISCTPRKRNKVSIQSTNVI